MMARYFYAWLPVVAVFGTVIVLASPYLALVVLLLVPFAVVASFVALTRAAVVALSGLARAAFAPSAPGPAREPSDAREPVALSTGSFGHGGAR